MPEPLVVTTLRQFRAALLAREYTQIAEMALHWRRMETNLEGLMMALAQDIAEQKAAGREITAGLLVRQERYKRLLAQVRDELKQYDDWLLPSIRERQMEYGSLGIQSAYEASRAAYDGYSDVLIRAGIDFDRLPITAIENMIGYAGDGSPLNKLLKKYNAKAVDAMTNALIDAVAVGTNPRETARQMANAFGIGLNDAMTLARTEQMRVYREAQREQYATSGNFIGYRRMCAKDDRTCIACLVADGRFYELETSFEEHPNGRCVLVPVPRDIPGYEWLSGQDWFMQQTAATQQAIMGKGAYAAWKDGKFGLPDVVKRVDDETWGASLIQKPLKELIPDGMQ